MKSLAEQMMRFCDEAAAVIRETHLEPGSHARILHGFATALLDNAWTMSKLLATSPARSHVTALTLWRPMYERWLRFGYFACCATDQEAEAFLATGKIPSSRTRMTKGRAQQMSQREFGQAISAVLPGTAHTFDALAGEYSATWCGLVHGGNELIMLYDEHREIGSKVHPGAVMALLYRVGVVVGVSVDYFAFRAPPRVLEQNAAIFAQLMAIGAPLIAECEKHALATGFLKVYTPDP